MDNGFAARCTLPAELEHTMGAIFIEREEVRR
jgi:hypothetical protein